MAHRCSGIYSHDDTALEDEGQSSGSCIDGEIPVLKSIILLSSPPEFLMLSQKS